MKYRLLAATILALAGLVGGAGWGAADQAMAATTQQPAMLSGETLVKPLGGTFTITCDSSGSFTFSMSGTALGPYAGTFTETGSGAISTTSTLTAFSAVFTIRSPQGTVIGFKTLSFPSSPYGCYHDATDFFFVYAPTSYSALIFTSNGVSFDRGTSVVLEVDEGSGLSHLVEQFTSSST